MMLKNDPKKVAAMILVAKDSYSGMKKQNEEASQMPEVDEIDEGYVSAMEEFFAAAEKKDPKAAAMLAEVDAVRMAVFDEKFRRLTGDTRMASELAALIYLAVAGGLQALARPGSDDRVAAYLRRVIADYLIHRQAPGASSSLAI